MSRLEEVIAFLTCFAGTSMFFFLFLMFLYVLTRTHTHRRDIASENCLPNSTSVPLSLRSQSGGRGDIVPHLIPDKDAHDSRFPRLSDSCTLQPRCFKQTSFNSRCLKQGGTGAERHLNAPRKMANKSHLNIYLAGGERKPLITQNHFYCGAITERTIY